MPSTRKPKRLDDVSHLFLSTTACDERAGAGGEICIWLSVDPSRFVRAYAAAGLAAAFAACGVDTTLLETGEGLPNAGFYFSLHPDDYLAPALDGGGVVAGRMGEQISFRYATRPADLAAAPSVPDPGRPHVLLVAWGGRGEEPATEDLVAACLPRLRGGRAWDGPSAIVRFGGGTAAARATATAGGGARPLRYVVDGDAGADERFDLPPAYGAGAARPLPPEEPLFREIAASLLQRLAGRGKERDETGAA